MLARLWIWTDAISVIIAIAVVGVYGFFSLMHIITRRFYRKYFKGQLLEELEHH